MDVIGSLACSSTVQPEQEHDFILVLVISPRLCARSSPTRMFRKVWNVLYATSSHASHHTEVKPENQQSAIGSFGFVSSDHVKREQNAKFLKPPSRSLISDDRDTDRPGDDGSYCVPFFHLARHISAEMSWFTTSTGVGRLPPSALRSSLVNRYGKRYRE